MKLIDLSIKGNVVRLYFGEDSCDDYYGDDWNDTPYECNAGPVYDEFVSLKLDIAFPFDVTVVEPCSNTINSLYCKDDFKRGDVPVLIAIPRKEVDGIGRTSWEYWAFIRGEVPAVRLYYNMDISDIIHSQLTKIPDVGISIVI